MSNIQKNILIAGATGVIGAALVDKFLTKKYRVHAVTNDLLRFSVLLNHCDRSFGANFIKDHLRWYTRIEASSCRDMDSLRGELVLHGVDKLDALIISFGLWPQHGLFEELGKPFTRAAETDWAIIESGYIHRILHFFGALVEVVKKGGKIIFCISSLADFANEECPPWLTAGHYESLKSRLDNIIRSLQKDRMFAYRDVHIHRIGISGKRKIYSEDISDPDTGIGKIFALKIIKRVTDALAEGAVLNDELIHYVTSEPI